MTPRERIATLDWQARSDTGQVRSEDGQDGNQDENCREQVDP